MEKRGKKERRRRKKKRKERKGEGKRKKRKGRKRRGRKEQGRRKEEKGKKRGCLGVGGLVNVQMKGPVPRCVAEMKHVADLQRPIHLSSPEAVGLYYFLFFIFFNFYLSMIVTERLREREAETQAEGEAGSMHRKPDVGFDPGSPGSALGQRQAPNY